MVNIAGGLSEMGATVAKTMGAATLEAQRGALEKERITLANQLAMERESAGRKEAHGLDMEKLGKQQEFDKWRVETTEAGATARTNISAGASIASAKMQIDAMAPVRAAQIEAHRVETEGRKLDNELKANVSTARRELQAATEAGDEAAIKAAKDKVAIYDEGAAFRAAQAKALSVDTDAKSLKLQSDKLISDRKEELLKAQNDPAKTAELKREVAILESSSKEERAEIALWQQQAKLAETAMTSTMTRLTTLQNSGLLTDESKALEQMLQRILKQQQREFEAASRQAKARLDALDPNKGTPRTEAPDLTKYLKGVNPPTGKPKPFPPGLADTPTAP